MLEFGNLVRTLYDVSAITSVYATYQSGQYESDQDVQDLVEYLTGTQLTSYDGAGYGYTPAASQLQASLNQAQSITDDLVATQGLLVDLADEDLTAEQQAAIIDQIRGLASRVSSTAQASELLGPDAEDLYISIGNGSYITIAACDLDLDMEEVDLSTAEGRESFASTIESLMDQAAGEMEHLQYQLERLEAVSSLVQYGEDGQDQIDSDAALAIAAMAATEATEVLSSLFAIDHTAADRATWLLGD